MSRSFTYLVLLSSEQRIRNFYGKLSNKILHRLDENFSFDYNYVVNCSGWLQRCTCCYCSGLQLLVTLPEKNYDDLAARIRTVYATMVDPPPIVTITGISQLVPFLHALDPDLVRKSVEISFATVGQAIKMSISGHPGTPQWPVTADEEPYVAPKPLTTVQRTLTGGMTCRQVWNLVETCKYFVPVLLNVEGQLYHVIEAHRLETPLTCTLALGEVKRMLNRHVQQCMDGQMEYVVRVVWIDRMTKNRVELIFIVIDCHWHIWRREWWSRTYHSFPTLGTAYWVQVSFLPYARIICERKKDMTLVFISDRMMGKWDQ